MFKAANQDYPPACYNYSIFGLAPYNERFKWLKRAADQGYPDALEQICNAYKSSITIDLSDKARTDKKALLDLVNRLETLEYYLKFAKQQGGISSYRSYYLDLYYGKVAEIYEKGIFGEMPKDYKKALYYYRLANKYDNDGTSRPYEKHIKRILELLNESNEEK